MEITRNDVDGCLDGCLDGAKMDEFDSELGFATRLSLEVSIFIQIGKPIM
jgi:hypothetical protein